MTNTEPFRIDSGNEWEYQYQIGGISISPRRLKEIFGKPVPNPGEPEKITGEYIFIATSGSRYSIHDWRSTNLSEGDNTPSPEEFWNISEPYELSIGGDEPVNLAELESFRDWLIKKCA